MYSKCCGKKLRKRGPTRKLKFWTREPRRVADSGLVWKTIILALQAHSPACSPRMRPRQRQLLPFAAVSMISLPHCSRAVAFVTARGGVLGFSPLARLSLQQQSRAGAAFTLPTIAVRSFRNSHRLAGSRSRSKHKAKMELAVVAVEGNAAVVAEDEGGETQAAVKTPNSKLLFAPPKFTPTPFA